MNGSLARRSRRAPLPTGIDSSSSPLRVFRPAVLIVAISVAVSLSAVRDWTDVKVPIACAAFMALLPGRYRLSSAVIGVLVGHALLGPFIGIEGRTAWVWVLAGVIAGLEVLGLTTILARTLSKSTSRLPSQRLLQLLLWFGVLAVVAAAAETAVLGTLDTNVSTPFVSTAFGMAIASCLTAMASTRRGSEWLSNSRRPGTELLAPLMVVLVTLAAVQVTRQLWAQRDEDRLTVVAESARSAILARWERETEVLAVTAESLGPFIAFDDSIFAERIEPFLAQRESTMGAALGTRSPGGDGWTVLEEVRANRFPSVSLPTSFWTKFASGGVVERDDVLLAVISVDLVADGQYALAVAYSIPEIIRAATSQISDFEAVLIEGSLFEDESQSGVRAGDAVMSGIVSLDGADIIVTATASSTFGEPMSTLLAVIGVEILIGLLLLVVLVVGADAQFKMTQERRRRENLLEAALDATPGMSVVFDKDFRVLAANRPVREEFPGDIPGLAVTCIFGLESDSGRRRMLEEALSTALEGNPTTVEIAEDNTQTDGSSPVGMRILEISAYPVVSPGGEPVGFLQSIDATERRNLAMRSAQSERMESLGALAGGLAHDFNNLLFVTLGNLQLMAMNETVASDDKLSKFVSRSMSAVERGAEITKSLLAVARSQPLEESAVSLSDLVKGILPLVRQALGAGRRVEVDIPDPNLQLMVDAGRLSSCILNLAFNARDAMGPNGCLRIIAHLDESAETIELSIADDGAGMPAEVVARAFEPFFTTKSPGSGTGLGLATVYAFAKQSGGTAFLESREGSGTTVTLVLPRYSGIPVAREVVAARRSGRRVVVADDEQSLAEMVAAWLIDMGIDARFATSPKAALELIETFEPDVLVSDANFGEELDGIELARLGTAIVPDMAVVFMTGYSTSMRELQELGERTLAKPFSREDLYAALSPLIAEEGGESATNSGRSSAKTGSRKKGRST